MARKAYIEQVAFVPQRTGTAKDREVLLTLVARAASIVAPRESQTARPQIQINEAGVTTDTSKAIALPNAIVNHGETLAIAADAAIGCAIRAGAIAVTNSDSAKNTFKQIADYSCYTIAEKSLEIAVKAASIVTADKFAASDKPGCTPYLKEANNFYGISGKVTPVLTIAPDYAEDGDAGIEAAMISIAKIAAMAAMTGKTINCQPGNTITVNTLAHGLTKAIGSIDPHTRMAAADAQKAIKPLLEQFIQQSKNPPPEPEPEEDKYEQDKLGNNDNGNNTPDEGEEGEEENSDDDSDTDTRGGDNTGYENEDTEGNSGDSEDSDTDSEDDNNSDSGDGSNGGSNPDGIGSGDAGDSSETENAADTAASALGSMVDTAMPSAQDSKAEEMREEKALKVAAAQKYNGQDGGENLPLSILIDGKAERTSSNDANNWENYKFKRQPYWVVKDITPALVNKYQTISRATAQASAVIARALDMLCPRNARRQTENQNTGDLTQRRLSNVITRPGDERLYTRKTSPKPIRLSISLLVDCSGSMGYELTNEDGTAYINKERIDEAHEMCIAIANACKGNVNIDLTVIGHYGSTLLYFTEGVIPGKQENPAGILRLTPQSSNVDAVALQRFHDHIQDNSPKAKYDYRIALLLSDGSPCIYKPTPGYSYGGYGSAAMEESQAGGIARLDPSDMTWLNIAATAKRMQKDGIMFFSFGGFGVYDQATADKILPKGICYATQGAFGVAEMLTKVVRHIAKTR